MRFLANVPASWSFQEWFQSLLEVPPRSHSGKWRLVTPSLEVQPLKKLVFTKSTIFWSRELLASFRACILGWLALILANRTGEITGVRTDYESPFSLIQECCIFRARVDSCSASNKGTYLQNSWTCFVQTFWLENPRGIDRRTLVTPSKHTFETSNPEEILKTWICLFRVICLKYIYFVAWDSSPFKITTMWSKMFWNCFLLHRTQWHPDVGGLPPCIPRGARNPRHICETQDHRT